MNGVAHYSFHKNLIMKKKVLIMTLAIVVCGVVGALAQNPGEVLDSIKDAKSWQELFALSDAIYGALILIGGYITPFIPGLNQIPKKVYQVLTLSIILGAVFIMFGSTTFVSGPVIYAIVTSVYEIFLKPIPKMV